MLRQNDIYSEQIAQRSLLNLARQITIFSQDLLFKSPCKCPQWCCWTGCCLPSLGWLLLLLIHRHGGHGTGVRLLLEESPGLVGLLLQVLVIGHQLDRIDNAVVVEEHARDLAGRVAVVLLNHAVDVITDLLTPLRRVQRSEALRIDLRQHLLLLLGEHLLLLHGSHLLWRHLLHGGGVHGLALRLHVVAVVATLPHIVTRTAAIVEMLATLATALATLVTAASLVRAILTTVHLTIVLPHAAELTALASHVVKVLHEVLLHLVKAALFALLVQLLGRHPELDGQGPGTEGCRLVEALNGSLGAVDIPVEHKVLPVSGLWVEVFALS